MQYIEVQWSYEFDNEVDEATDKWLNHPTKKRAYIPEKMVRDSTLGVVTTEQAFERLTGIWMKHIIVFDSEPYYVLDEDLDFVDITDDIDIENY